MGTTAETTPHTPGGIMTNEPLKATQPLPCPLCCGKAASYFDRSCDCCGQPSGVVHCLNCGCEINHRATEAEALTAWNTRAVNSHHDLIEALRDVGASLAAAISLLERGGKAAKKAAPSDRMFDQMVKDYKASLNRTRAILTKEAGQ